MTISLNHTIVHSRDRDATAAWFTDLFGLPPAVPAGPFLQVDLANGVSLDFAGGSDVDAGQHYAFLISEAEFSAIYGRIVERGIQHWADPQGRHASQINHNDGGRGVYFQDPNGHYLEIITRPYGG